MVFSTPTFLLLFLPAALLLYGIARLARTHGTERVPNLLLLLASLFFYAWGEGILVLGMLFVIAVNYACGHFLQRTEGSALRRGLLVVSVVLSLSVLGFFKYFNFFIDSWNGLVESVGFDEIVWLTAPEITLPLGISFYTFQALSYSIDAYRRTIRPTRSFIDLACYVSMFPQLVAGPIVRYRDVAEKLVHRSIEREDFAEGVRRFIVGLGKKMLVANTLAVPADVIFSLDPEELSTATAWFGAICYTLQIYYDFSGYSDMAIGLGKMLGFNFPENFRYPYASRSIREFWRRWHISLSTWFRDYLYVPLGGNRSGAARTYANLLVVFILCGLWHGASFTFVLWGLFHGVFLSLERTQFGRLLERMPKLVSHAYVLAVVISGWVVFRAETLSAAGGFFAAMTGVGAPAGRGPGLLLTPEVGLALGLGALFSLPILPAAGSFLEPRLVAPGARMPASAAVAGARLLGLAVVLLLCGGLLAAGTHNPFIYFRF
jgi:alginate O-acetyltransferase complex protein AlgI